MKERSGLLIRGRLIDGTGALPIEDGALLIDDHGRIANVGLSSTVAVDGAVSVMDVRPFTMLPGLIDAHVHLVSCRHHERSISLTTRDIAASVLHGARNAREAVQNGVTTVRDCGACHHGIFDLRTLTEVGELLGPRIVLAGCAISTTGGHGPNVSVAADGDAAVRAAARAQIGAGADFVKVMLTGGTATRHERIEDVQFTAAELLAIVDEAHRRNKRVAAHCSCLAGARLAVDCGVDTIEHGIMLDDELCARMAENRISLVTTTALTRFEAQADPTDGTIPAYTRAKAKVASEQQAASLERAIAAGVPVAAGTDADGVIYPFGSTLPTELESLQQAGLTPLEAIRAGTFASATAIGRAKELGSLEVGKLADAIVVDGDPSGNLDALRRVRLVIIDGIVRYENRDVRADGDE